MEEVKQSRVHLDLAKRIVDKIANGESHISQQAAVNILKELLEGHIALEIRNANRIPEKWFKSKKIDKVNLTNELSSYLQQINFAETELFNENLEKKFNNFKY